MNSIVNSIVNSKKILEMAKEAGFEFNSVGGTFTSGYLEDYLQRFANLVAAAERERVTEMLNYLNMKAQPYHNFYRHAAVELNRKAGEGEKV